MYTKVNPLPENILRKCAKLVFEFPPVGDALVPP